MSLDLMLDLWLYSDTFRHPEFVCMSKFTILRLPKDGKWQWQMANVAMLYSSKF